MTMVNYLFFNLSFLTDRRIGNVTYEVPAFHGSFTLPSKPTDLMHASGFQRVAGTDEAHRITVKVAKGMALSAWRILVDDDFAQKMKDDFEQDKLLR